MNKRELFEAFLKEEKRYEKLKENFEEKVQKHLSLLNYLGTKIKKTIDSSKSNLDIAIEQVEKGEVRKRESLADYQAKMRS